MHNIINLLPTILQIALVTCIFALPLSRPPKSPCPKIFNYHRLNPLGDIIFPGHNDMLWKGVITLPAKSFTHGEALLLKVLLAVPVVLQPKYLSRIEFEGEKHQFLNGEIDSGRYNVFFPNNSPVPHLLQISVNDVVVCNGIMPSSPITTKILLHNSIFPIRVNLTRRGFDNLFTDSEFVKFDNLTTKECGDYTLSNPLVVRGRLSSAGEWPWLVPIFQKVDTKRGLQFICSGTLVSHRHIITAAHCLWEVEDYKKLVAYPGRRNIYQQGDSEVRPRVITTVHIHPDFRPDVLYSDLAVLELLHPLSWSSIVYPACLWTMSPQLDVIEEKTATVVGWGTDVASKVKLTAEPNSVELPVVSQETCLRSSREFFFLSSNRTLCAGARNGSGPCNGDSGSGLYIPVQDASGSTWWYLRGVVSLSLMDPVTQRCNLNHYTVFTDVARFRHWLDQVLENEN